MSDAAGDRPALAEPVEVSVRSTSTLEGVVETERTVERSPAIRPKGHEVRGELSVPDAVPGPAPFTPPPAPAVERRPTVRVTVGRIEIVPEEPAAARPRARLPRPRVTLDRYLDERRGGGGGTGG